MRLNALAGFGVAAFVFAAVLPGMFFGLDLGDTGNQLARQQSLVVFGEIRGGQAATLLSDLVGGIWQEIGPSAGALLWMRLGGGLLCALSSAAAFFCLVRFFPVRDTAVAVGASGALLGLIAPYEILVHYYTVPAFLITIVLLLIVEMARRGSEGSPAVVLSVLCGALMGVAIIARLPLLVLLPVAGLAASCTFPVKPPSARKNIWSATGGMLAGTGLALLVAVCVLWSTGLLGAYFQNILFTFGSSPSNDLAEHNLLRFLPVYCVRGVKAMVIAAVTCVLIAVPSGGRFRLSAGLRRASIVAVFLLILLCKTDGPAQALMRFREVLLGLVVCVTVIEWVRGERRSISFLLLAGGTVAGVAMAFGSALGLQSATYGLWIGLPAAMLVGTEHLEDVRTRREIRLAFGLAAVAVSVFAGVIRQDKDWNHFGTKLTDWRSTEPASHPKLLGIRVEPERLRNIEAAACALGRASKRGDTTLCFNHVGLFYWLTDTRSYFESPVLYHSRPEVVPAQLARLLAAGRLPCAVLFGPGRYTEDIRDRKVIESTLLDANGYVKACSAGLFDIYARP